MRQRSQAEPFESAAVFVQITEAVVQRNVMHSGKFQ